MPPTYNYKQATVMGDNRTEKNYFMVTWVTCPWPAWVLVMVTRVTCPWSPESSTHDHLSHLTIKPIKDLRFITSNRCCIYSRLFFFSKNKHTVRKLSCTNYCKIILIKSHNLMNRFDEGWCVSNICFNLRNN